MSRLDDLGEILEGYEGRKYEGEKDKPIRVQDIKDKLCEGGHENHYRAGLLVAKKPPNPFGYAIVDVIVPEQDSDIAKTIVKDWDAAVKKAEEIGELGGTVFYVGNLSLELAEATRMTHDNLCKKYRISNLCVAINSKNQFSALRTNEPTR